MDANFNQHGSRAAPESNASGSGATARQGPEFAEGCGPAGHWPQGKAPQSMGVGFIRALLSRAVLSSYASVLTNDAQLHASVCTGVHT